MFGPKILISRLITLLYARKDPAANFTLVPLQDGNAAPVCDSHDAVVGHVPGKVLLIFLSSHDSDKVISFPAPL